MTSSQELFQADAIYQRVFRQDISVAHVYLVNSLAGALDDWEYNLKGKIAANKATALEVQQYEVLKYSMSKHFVMYLLGQAAEELLQSRVADPFGWKVKLDLIKPGASTLDKAWKAALQALPPQVSVLVSQKGSAYDVVRSMDLSKKVSEEPRALVASLQQVLGSQFSLIQKRTTW